jgi:hypothetical protein
MGSRTTALLWAFLTVLAGQPRMAMGMPLVCADAAQERASEYRAIKDNPEYIVGEGVALLRDHDDDAMVAERLALDLAGLDLSLALQGGKSAGTTNPPAGGSMRVGESWASPGPDLSNNELKDVCTRTLMDFPHAGQVTVLAWITRQDYHAQRGGRLDDSPHWGLECFFSSYAPGQGSDLTRSGNDTAGPGAGVQASWGPWSLALGADFIHFQLRTYDPRSQRYGQINTPGSPYSMLGLGYDVAPWRTRVQPYLPLRVEGALAGSGPWTAAMAGAGAGLGLRVWFTNHVALDVRGLWNGGMGNVRVQNGASMLLAAPGRYAQVNCTGPQWTLGLMITD